MNALAEASASWRGFFVFEGARAMRTSRFRAAIVAGFAVALSSALRHDILEFSARVLATSCTELRMGLTKNAI